MNTLETMRLYLRDQSTQPRFSDEDLQLLHDNATTLEGAVAMGWLLMAADSSEDPVSQSIGNTSESWGQVTERYKVAKAMYDHWTRRDKELNGDDSMTLGLWWRLVPDEDGGIIGRLFAHQETMETLAATA